MFLTLVFFLCRGIVAYAPTVFSCSGHLYVLVLSNLRYASDRHDAVLTTEDTGVDANYAV